MKKVSGIGISLMPEYYSRVLKQMEKVSENDLFEALLLLSSSTSFYTGKEILNQIKNMAVSGRGIAMYYDAKIKEMLALLVEWYDNRNAYKNSDKILDTDRKAIEGLIALLSQKLKKPLPISECRKYTCMSKGKLSFIFRQITNKTISEYYQYLRVEKSKELLVATGKNIEQIANIVGYQTHAAFSAVFKLKCGLSPKEYRQHHWQNKQEKGW
ncbi:hypothetical protein AZF37_00200 [endosymbiont 'TC1' of Trimyema compressum]|uniref:helix-turn-helix domain-containing protein n=1 Tax=endosymbiont 'TC1' of Trimyema compressum TaxID=243899 RepID=UPI0007F186B0|nr:AraC family transcriptional regulator [endosymbiont 'TC1' of Trimyema compressum]AMP19804.1 hypothetical protein AZF37_00200 [endosymbiont 'TC1' of Trimyema compressum]